VVTDLTPAHDTDTAQNRLSGTPKGHSEVTCGEEQGEPRRSHRERHPPPKFTYEELGKPLILALSQFFGKFKDIIPDRQIPCQI